MSEEEWKEKERKRGLVRGGEGEGEGREESSPFFVQHQSQYLVQKCPPQTHVGEAVMGERWEVGRGGGGERDRKEERETCWDSCTMAQCTTYVHMYILMYAHTSSVSKYVCTTYIHTMYTATYICTYAHTSSKS